MTNEEASRRLDCMDRFLKTRYNDYSERDHEAFLLAIEALKERADLLERAYGHVVGQGTKGVIRELDEEN